MNHCLTVRIATVILDQILFGLAKLYLYRHGRLPKKLQLIARCLSVSVPQAWFILLLDWHNQPNRMARRAAQLHLRGGAKDIDTGECATAAGGWADIIPEIASTSACAQQQLADQHVGVPYVSMEAAEVFGAQSE